MDKYEFNIKIDQIRKRMDEGDYSTAMRIADAIDWSRVRNINLLSLASSVYEMNGEFDEAKDKLLMAFERAPIGKRLLYKLTELSVKTGDLDEAKDYYNEFLDVAPEDPSAHVLAYMILERSGAPYDRLISELSAYAAAEPDEKWLYELAKVYDEAGQSRECVAVCDRIALLFGKGKYSEQALRLKAKYQSLSHSQQELIHEEPHTEDMDRRSPEEIGNELAAIRYENEDEAFEEYLRLHGLDKPLVDVEETVAEAETSRVELREELSKEVEKLSAPAEAPDMENGTQELEKTLILDGERLSELRSVIIKNGEQTERADKQSTVSRMDAAIAVKNAAKQAAGIAASIERPAVSISVEAVKPVPAPGLGKEDIAPVLEAEKKAEELKGETKTEALEEAKTEAPASESREPVPVGEAAQTVTGAAKAAGTAAAEAANAAVRAAEDMAGGQTTSAAAIAGALGAGASLASESAKAAGAMAGAASEARPPEPEAKLSPSKEAGAAADASDKGSSSENKAEAQKKAPETDGRQQEVRKAPAKKHHMIIEAEDAESGFEIAKDELKTIHREYGIQNAALKTSAEKLNERGLSDAAIEKIRGKDFIIEHAGALSPKLLDTIYRLIRDDESGMIAVLIDVPEGLDRREERKPEIFGLCDLVSDFDEEYEDYPEEEISDEGPDDGYEDEIEDDDAAYDEDSEPEDELDDEEAYDDESYDEASDYDEDEDLGHDDGGYDESDDDYDDDFDDDYDEDEDYEEDEELRKRGSRKQNAELHNNLKVQAPKAADEQMEIDDFAQYCCQYASEIDCSITGKSMLALYERIELMEEDSIPLTKKNAVRLIEEAADRAEKPPIGKRLKGMFSSKYDKNGLLILKEEDFIY